MMMRPVGIQVFHLVLLKTGLFDCINRAKAMLESRTRANVAQFGLDHRAQIAGRVVPKLDYFARLALKNYDHASSDLGR